MPHLATSAKVRVAMIGAGSMANTVHYPSLASFGDVEFAGICDLDAERLQQTADKYGIERRFCDYREMIEKTAPDAVYAVGQPNFMYPIWTWCLEHKLNLFIEKPLGLSLHQARALAYLAERNGCITQVGFQRRTCPMVVRLREECLKRGPITQGVVRFYKFGPSPHLGAADHMFDDGVHVIDTLRWICGGEATRIHAVGKRIGTPDLNYFSALVEFDNGATGMLMMTWSTGRRVFDVEMHAPGVYAQAEHEGKGYLYADNNYQGVEYDTRQVADSDQLYVFGGFQAKDREFIDAVKGGPQPGSHFGDAVKTIEIAERVLGMVE
jgi:virulence factor